MGLTQLESFKLSNHYLHLMNKMTWTKKGTIPQHTDSDIYHTHIVLAAVIASTQLETITTVS